MRASEHRRWLLEQVVRLRRAERVLPPNRDLVAARVALERELGGTVPQACAAQALGVSHTTLARWIRSGDVPVVIGATGRREIAVSTVAELVDAVEAARGSSRRRHVLEPAMLRGRERAAALDIAALAPPVASADPHDRARRRSLAIHRAVAARLDTAHVDAARRRIWAWRIEGALDPRWADAWEALLDEPLELVRTRITAEGPDGDDLRQSSPFAGVLGEPERRRILREVS